MSKASWEDTPPVRRLIARILALAGLPGLRPVTVNDWAGYVRADVPTSVPTDTPALIAGIGSNGVANWSVIPDQSGYNYAQVLAYGGAANPTTGFDCWAQGADTSHAIGEVNGFATPGKGVLVSYAAAAESSDFAEVDILAQADGDSYRAAVDLFCPPGQTYRAFGISGNTGPVRFEIMPNGDIILHDPTAGVVLTAPDNTKHRIKVANNGTLSTEVVT